MTDTPDPVAAQAGEKADVPGAAHNPVKVEITRDLSGSGHLARGAKTRFSKLKFRAVKAPPTPAQPLPADEAAAPATGEDAEVSRTAAARPPPAPPAAEAASDAAADPSTPP